MIQVNIQHQRGDFALDVAFEGHENQQVIALYGASGAGKSTILQAIAGLCTPDRGQITVNGETLFDSASGLSLSPHARRVGYIFQDSRLFPHMTVQHNLTYGAHEVASRHAITFENVVETLGIGQLLNRKPHTLSGGEAQRVAIGRALLSQPRLLLLDEPLASLDRSKQDELLAFLRTVPTHFGIPMVLVSHRRREILALADTLVHIEEGKVVQSGPLESVLDSAPLRDFGTVTVGRVLRHLPEQHMTELQLGQQSLWVPLMQHPPNTTVRVQIQPQDVLVATLRPEGISAQNVLEATIASIGPTEDGSACRVRLDAGFPIDARLTSRAVEQLGLRAGMNVYAITKTVAFPGDRVTPTATQDD